MKLLAVTLLCSAACAQPALSPPLVGVLRDDQNQLRRIFGIAADFVAGDPENSEALAVASSGRFSLVKLPDHLLVIDEQSGLVRAINTPEGRALLAFHSDASPALAYFPSTGELISVEDTGQLISIEFGGDLLAIAALDGGRIRAVVRREGALSVIRLANGSVEAEEELPPGSNAPALILHDGTILYSSGADLIIRRAHAIEKQLQLGSPVEALEQMGDGWALARPADRSPLLAIRITADSESVYRLPLKRTLP